MHVYSRTSWKSYMCLGISVWFLVSGNPWQTIGYQHFRTRQINIAKLCGCHGRFMALGTYTVHTPGNFSKLADWVLRMPRRSLTGYWLFSAKILDAGTQRRYDTRHEMLTQHALYCIDSKHAESAICDAYRTSSGRYQLSRHCV